MLEKAVKYSSASGVGMIVFIFGVITNTWIISSAVRPTDQLLGYVTTVVGMVTAITMVISGIAYIWAWDKVNNKKE